MGVSFIDAGSATDVGKLSVSEIVIEDLIGVGKSAWAALDRSPFPNAGESLAGNRSGCQIEFHISRDHQIQLAVAIIIDEGATGAPIGTVAGNARLFGNFFECSVALVMVETILAVVGDV